MELKYLLVAAGTVLSLFGINFSDLANKNLQGKSKKIYTVSVLLLAAILIIVLACTESKEKEEQKLSDKADKEKAENKEKKIKEKEFDNAIFLSLKELEWNKEYLNQLRHSIKYSDKTIIIGTIKYEKVVSFADTKYDELSQHSYGEEKNLYRLIMTLQESADEFKRVKNFEDLLIWNKSYELTIDDLYFLNCFLYWYIGSTFEERGDVMQYFSPWSFSNDAFGKNETVYMRYFVFDGKPVKTCTDYLGYID